MNRQSLFFALLLFLIPLLHCDLERTEPATENSEVISSTKQQRYWKLQSNYTIVRDFSEAGSLPYADNIEMAGRKVAGIINYTIDTSRQLKVERQIFFPQLRTHLQADDPAWYVYRAYLKDIYGEEILPKLLVGQQFFVPGPLERMEIDGILKFHHGVAESGLRLSRVFFPSMESRLFVEEWTLTNMTDSLIEIKNGSVFLQQKEEGLKGLYTRTITSTMPEKIQLAAGAEYTFEIKIAAQLNQEKKPGADIKKIKAERTTYLNQLRSALILETPEPVLNALFEFSKVRAAENIFDSKLGLVHSPGGGRYYCGFWANDQAEYVGPFFPYLGYDLANEATLNMYRLYAKEINPEYKNIRYSFEMEGDAPINPLDRGDAAMIAYGASQFVMAYGDSEVAKELWPLIEWCLEYCHRQLNAEGVVESESDEMEGRIETGTANLSTSSLYYGALNLAVDLVDAIPGKENLAKQYQARAVALSQAIENYFGATVEGLATYKYYDTHQYLRHWICLPLVVNIHDRKEATIEALFDRLWSSNGVHVEKNSDNEAVAKIFWDRATLYALRGTFYAGATDRSLEKIMQFSEERLLGARVPYVVEAYPEGNMAHLSAESGLYCRIFIEGLFGIVPRGLNRFECTPGLPKNWEQMALRKIKAFGRTFDLQVRRINADELVVELKDEQSQILFNQSFEKGESVLVELK